MRVILILMFCFVPTAIKAQETQTPNEQRLSAKQKEVFLNKNLDGVLRGFVWGLPPTVILENERGTFAGQEDIGEGDVRLFYLDYIKGMRSTIGYDFKNDQLWRARIFIEKKYSNPQERLEDLMTIRKDLVKRFGQPVDETMTWYDNKERNWPDSWGWAVLRGELMMRIVFRNKETEVVAFLGAKQKLNPRIEDPDLNVTYTRLSAKKEPDIQNIFNTPYSP